MDKQYNKLIKEFGETNLKINEPMNEHTSFKIGGSAQYYLTVDKIEDLIKAVVVANDLSIPYLIIGGGTNMIVSDNGIKGLVIKNNCRAFKVIDKKEIIENQEIDESEIFIYTESGAIMNLLVRFAIDQGLSGLEYQLGLPGTIGGGIYMNSNFAGKQVFVGNNVYSATLLTKSGKLKEVNDSYFNFSYDRSILQDTHETILSLVLRFIPEDKNILLERAMGALEYRRLRMPKEISTGFTYRNISINQSPRDMSSNDIKSAINYIEEAGFVGKSIGDVVIHEHPNFILNIGNAKSKDVVKLFAIVKEKIWNKFGIQLLMETHITGI
ncbi:UDP-N-acetylenolpyruvoylglucosamine reductase [Candidatus Levyibacteriota bacterium]|nr:FAD-binding protein [Candidatus Levybacteria bacterium]GDX61876.1 UDP-N-acetylenolpyruvoylglucosamine reductase [Candidatus Levybacteria bacterium]